MTANVGPVSPFPPSSQKPPPVNLEDTLKKLLKQADKDGDGQLDQGEFAGIAGALNALMPPQPGQTTDATAMFQQADANHDGKVSIDELKNFVVDRMQQGMQATNQASQDVQDGKKTVFSSVGGVTLSPDMQLSLMQNNLTQAMTQRVNGAAAYAQGASNSQAYSAANYFKADSTTVV